MRKTRVMVAGMSRMLKDILKTVITSQDDFEFVGELVGMDGLMEATRELSADVVIIAVPRGGDPTRANPDLGGPPRLIVTIEDEGRRATLHQWRECITSIGEVSPDSLISALRDCGAAGSGLPAS